MFLFCFNTVIEDSKEISSLHTSLLYSYLLEKISFITLIFLSLKLMIYIPLIYNIFADKSNNTVAYYILIEFLSYYLVILRS